MKNKRLRNSLIAASIAIATGVILFGVNAAIGDAPDYQPPGTGVSPVFTDVHANGDITADGFVFAPAIVGNGAYFDGLVTIEDDISQIGGTAALGDVEAQSLDAIGNTETATLTVTADADIRGNVSDSLGNFTINDTLNVTGSLYDSGGHFTIDDTVNIMGNVYDSNSNFTIDDALNVTGNVYDSNSNFTIDDALNVTGNVYDSNSYFTIDDSLNVTGNIYDSNSWFTIGDTVDVNGHLRADSIGSFYKNTNYVWSNSWAGINAYCNSNDILLGCWGGWLDISDSNKQWVTSQQHATTPTNRYGCYMNGQNNTGASKRFYMWVSCFNPNA